jgi:hypothetical protein
MCTADAMFLAVSNYIKSVLYLENYEGNINQ